jgi:hypothetical protein
MQKTSQEKYKASKKDRYKLLLRQNVKGSSQKG